MNSDRLHRQLTLAANIGVLLGIMFLAIEIRQNSHHLALQLEFAVPTQKIFEINRDLMDPTIAKILAKSIQSPAELTFEEGLVAASFVLNALNEWEDRYLLHKSGMDGVVDWKRHIQENIDWTLGNRFALTVYNMNREAFEVEFVDYVDSLLGEVSEDGTYLWWTKTRTRFLEE
ncbi:hypothetical protein E2F43_18745 [Seongchinamella unica]|uniref:Uncharacterized protein n=1 Tax=Seongchinamella unica TaxID=2547392 RepID=A0A4R5LMP5_9GAMM|nr:hypothetical protein [Seongchinamella unica]TDG11296.1 hypothetical protein E2F43_18745 [Seongchinamella unica]